MVASPIRNGVIGTTQTGMFRDPRATGNSDFTGMVRNCLNQGATTWDACIRIDRTETLTNLATEAVTAGVAVGVGRATTMAGRPIVGQEVRARVAPTGSLRANITNGTRAEYDEAAGTINSIREGAKGVQKLGGNVGYIEGNINGHTYSPRDTFVGTGARFENGVRPVFTAKRVNSKNEIEGPGAYFRNTDSEFILLNKLAHDLVGSTGSMPNRALVYPSFRGEIKLVSENPFCASCSSVIYQFSNMFPNIRVVAINGAKP